MQLGEHFLLAPAVAWESLQQSARTNGHATPPLGCVLALASGKIFTFVFVRSFVLVFAKLALGCVLAKLLFSSLLNSFSLSCLPASECPPRDFCKSLLFSSELLVQRCWLH